MGLKREKKGKHNKYQYYTTIFINIWYYPYLRKGRILKKIFFLIFLQIFLFFVRDINPELCEFWETAKKEKGDCRRKP